VTPYRIDADVHAAAGTYSGGVALIARAVSTTSGAIGLSRSAMLIRRAYGHQPVERRRVGRRPIGTDGPTGGFFDRTGPVVW
jgi:hypothetical protein